jgi:hypothetical protein
MGCNGVGILEGGDVVLGGGLQQLDEAYRRMPVGGGRRRESRHAAAVVITVDAGRRWLMRFAGWRGTAG